MPEIGFDRADNERSAVRHLPIDGGEGHLGSVRENVASAEGQSEVDTIAQSLREVKDSALTITMALQVQDITAQKIAAVNHLIESVRTELLHELNYFQSAGEDDAVISPSEDIPQPQGQEAHAFDKNASFRKSAEHQQRIDEVVLAWKEKQSFGRTAV